MAGERSAVIEKIRQRMQEESDNPPTPRTLEDIPVSYEAITTEWLALAIERWFPQAKLKLIRLGPKDDGCFNRRRIYLEWEYSADKNLPKTVFCKAAQDIENRILLAHGGTFSEVTFYTKIRPNVDFETPIAYFAGYDPVSWASLIIMKDMGDATFGSHHVLLSQEQFMEQVQLIATLHGTYYKSKEDFFPQILSHSKRFENLCHGFDLEDACTKGFRAAKAVIPPKLFAREAEVWPATLKSVRRNGSLPETLVHSDLHLGNWYITTSGHMGLTDWQAMSRGHWSRDLAYVLATSVPTKERRLWEHNAVRLYIAELAKAGGPKVPEDEAWLELRRQTFGVLWYWTITLTPPKNMPPMQKEGITLDFIGRIAALIDDHDALGSFNS